LRIKKNCIFEALKNKIDFVAQLVEQLTLNQRVRSSILRGVTKCRAGVESESDSHPLCIFPKATVTIAKVAILAPTLLF
jgi:hypothetical protein